MNPDETTLDKIVGLAVETERDKAIAERDEARKSRYRWIDAANALQDNANRLEAERDEALDKYDAANVKCLAAIGENIVLEDKLTRCVDECSEAITGWEEAQGLLERTLEREKVYYQELNKARKQFKELWKQCIEARHVARRLWQQCKAADKLSCIARFPVSSKEVSDALEEYEAVRLKPREEVKP